LKSLQNKILLFFVLLLLVVQAIAFWTLYSVNTKQEMAEINSRLTTAKTIFNELFDRRLDYLAAFAETAAQDYGLKQVFNDDTRSLLVALNNHRARIDADLVMAISASGIITGQLQREFDLETNEHGKVSEGVEHGQNFRFPQWLESGQVAHLYLVDEALYQLSLSPITVGSKRIGWLAFGFQIDQRLASEFKSITGLNTNFVLKDEGIWRLIASSRINVFQTRELQLAEKNLAREIIQSIAPNQYIATHSLITEFDQQELGVVMYGLRANFVALLQQQWWGLLALAALTLFGSLGAAYFISASITRPVKRLVAQAKIVASGNYQQPIAVTDKDELGQLAQGFNEMQVAVLSRENSIMYRSNHDPLTDLPNRHVLNRTLADLTSQTQPFTVLHLNISRLKDVNDTLGHNVGDEVIKEFARRLKVLTRIEYFKLLAHICADEFVFLVSSTDLDEITSLIHNVLEASFDYQGVSLQLQVHMGVALYPENSKDAKILMQMADTALHHTRRTGKLVQLYSADYDVNTIERLNLINDLKYAIPAGELELHFQPKLCLRTMAVIHVEALVRWQHPTLGMVPPDDFIHIAEQTGQIKALTRWVFTTALNQFNIWDKLGINLNVAINVSAENLKEADFHQFIFQTIKQTGVPAERITLEVTESAVVEDPQAAIQLLSQFKKHGIKLSIDDYGTGYSSLAQLKQLPVHELKIDKSFIQRLEHDEDDQIIVLSTIELARNMGLSIVAEGVEDEYSLNWLAKHGCELAQGYFISRPKPALELTKWLLENPVLSLTSSINNIEMSDTNSR
jgi:diguanylate cyclase (GGDEF)-like protein